MAKLPVRRKQSEAMLRIIGGDLRGRKFRSSGDPATRPMKDRVREAVFNLVGPSIRGAHAIDLFAGTGAVALEAISRGAVRATALERNFEMARLIERNAEDLGVRDRVEVVPGNTFIWMRQLSRWKQQQPAGPWVVFCCPPYQLYQTQWDALRGLLEQFQAAAPAGSLLVVEADTRFDFQLLPAPTTWDVRDYPPARVGLQRPAAAR